MTSRHIDALHFIELEKFLVLSYRDMSMGTSMACMTTHPSIFLFLFSISHFLSDLLRSFDLAFLYIWV